MDQKQVKLNSILTLFKHLIRNVSASDDFDYHSDPVDSHTYWNYINPDSVRVVYNLNGNNAPEIDTHHWYDQKGIVITFDSSMGGNCQIFLNRHVLALRQIGNPAGWSYLGLDGNDKLYVDEDTLHILHNITAHAYHHNAVTLDTNQSIHGQKDFTILPLYNGQPLVYHSEFHKLVSYVHMNDKHLSDLDNRFELLSNTANDANSLVNDFKSSVKDTYATKSDLNNYVPTNQLRYYVTQKQFEDALNNSDTKNIENAVQKINTRFNDLKSQISSIKIQNGHATSNDISNVQNSLHHYIDQEINTIDLGKVKDTIHKMNERYNNLVNNDNANDQNFTKKLDNLQNSIDIINNTLSHLDLGKVKDTIHKINIRANNTNHQIASNVNSLTSEINGLSSGVSNNASRANSADTRFVQLNEHNKKQDKIVRDLESHATSNSTVPSTSNASTNLLSSEVSNNASRLNSSAADLYDLKHHLKRMNKRDTDFAQSASSAITSLNDKVNHLYAENSQDAQDYYNQAEQDESEDINSLDSDIKEIKTALGSH